MKAGIDDFGSGRFRGYSCIVLSNRGATQLNEKAMRIRADAGLQEFHGKEFRAVRDLKAYKSFAQAIRDALALEGEYASFQLVHEDIFKEIFVDFAKQVADGTLAKVGSAPPEFILRKAGELFALARGLGEIKHCSGEVDIDMDWDHPDDEQAAREVMSIHGNHAAIITDAKDGLRRLANAYKNQRFPTGPRFGNIRPCDSKNSVLVQAADVIANFGVNYVKSQLRRGATNSSQTEAEKASIYASIIPTEALPTNTLAVTVENVLNGGLNDNIRFQIMAFPC